MRINSSSSFLWSPPSSKHKKFENDNGGENMNTVNTYYLIRKYHVEIIDFMLWLIDMDNCELIAVVSPYFNKKGTPVVTTEVPL